MCASLLGAAPLRRLSAAAIAGGSCRSRSVPTPGSRASSSFVLATTTGRPTTRGCLRPCAVADSMSLCRLRALSTAASSGGAGTGAAAGTAAAAAAAPKPPLTTQEKLHKYGPLLLLNFGNSAALLSFCMTDVFYLRCLALVATSCGVIFNLTHAPPLRLSAAWGVVFFTVNGLMILNLLMEEEEIYFTKEELDLFEEHFLPYGLSPTQFRKVMGRGKWADAPAGTVLAVEGEPLSRLLLIASGRVQASVNQVPVSSFSTFPGARSTEANRGIDSGAWIGEINFLDGDKKAKGAIATFVTESPSRYVAWEHQSLRELLTEEPTLSRGMTNAITGALVGKILAFTHTTKAAAAAMYDEILHTVLVDERVEPSEKAFVREYRQRHGISDALHTETLARLGWTAEEYEDGMKHGTQSFSREAAGAFRRINEGIIRRQTTIMAGATTDDDDDDDDEEEGEGERDGTDSSAVAAGSKAKAAPEAAKENVKGE